MYSNVLKKVVAFGLALTITMAVAFIPKATVSAAECTETITPFGVIIIIDEEDN